MRKLATLFCLAVLCISSASAQWNLAQDPKASLDGQSVTIYSAEQTSTGVDVQLKSETKGGISDEIFIWRTGTGATAYTLSDAAVYDPTLITFPTETALEAQCEATVLKGVATGLQDHPLSNVATTKVWFVFNGTTRSMNFEIRWEPTGVVVTRLPDDVQSGTVS